MTRAEATGRAGFWTLLHAQRVKVAQGRAAEALPTLRGLAADNPDHAETLGALAEALGALGRTAEWRRALRAAVEAVPADHPWMGRLRSRWSRALTAS